MARITDGFLENQAYSKTGSKMVNLKHGGHFGHVVDEQGFFLGTPAPSEHGFCRLVSPPLGVNSLDAADRKLWIMGLKALFELHAETFEGIPYGVEVEKETVAIGGDGQGYRVPTNVTRQETNITMNFGKELSGQPKFHFFEGWINLFIGDPQTKMPVAASFDNAGEFQKNSEYYGATALFIEPDAWHRKPLKAVLVRDLFPSKSSDEEIKRALTSAKEVREVSIELGGHATYGPHVMEMAQIEMDKMARAGFNPNNRKAVIDQLSPSLEGLPGYSERVAEVAGAL